MARKHGNIMKKKKKRIWEIFKIPILLLKLEHEGYECPTCQVGNVVVQSLILL